MAKIIILGAGLVGSVMAKDLAKAHEVCSVDLNQMALEPLFEAGIKTLCTDVSNKDTLQKIIKEYDIVADGSDNFETRFILNDNCFKQKKILVSGAVQGFEGYISTFKFLDRFSSPCYRCIFPEPPPENSVDNCSTAGILGSVAGVVGSMQATEIVKEVLGIGSGLMGWLLIFDGINGDFRKIKVPKDPKCFTCST